MKTAAFGAAGAAALTLALAASLRLPPAARRPSPGSGVACKAVPSAAAARGCPGVEVDLNLTQDGVWVLAHDRDFRGRPLARQTWAEVQDALTNLDDFARDAQKERFALVNLDLKDRSLWPGDGRLRRALISHREALESLSKKGLVVISSPVPARYAELHRYLAEAGLPGVVPALELVDYDAAQSRRWGLPLSWWEGALLPAAGLASRLYLRLNRDAIPWITVQEKTARQAPPSGPEILCWTRDEEKAPPPSACPWTTRAKGP